MSSACLTEERSSPSADGWAQLFRSVPAISARPPQTCVINLRTAGVRGFRLMAIGTKRFAGYTGIDKLFSSGTKIYSNTNVSTSMDFWKGNVNAFF